MGGSAVVEAELACPAAVITPAASKTMSWWVSMRPECASSNLPQRTEPGAASASGAIIVSARRIRNGLHIGVLRKIPCQRKEGEHTSEARMEERRLNSTKRLGWAYCVKAAARPP